MRKVIIGLIIFFILVTVWGLYSFYKTADTFDLSQPQIVPHIPEQLKEPTQTSTNNLADWLTYRSEELGFEFKYPKDMVVSNEIIDTSTRTSSYDDCLTPFVKVSVGYQNAPQLIMQYDVCKIPDFKKKESESYVNDSIIQIKRRTYLGEGGDDEFRLFYYYFDINNVKWRAEEVYLSDYNTTQNILKTVKEIRP